MQFEKLVIGTPTLMAYKICEFWRNNKIKVVKYSY